MKEKTQTQNAVKDKGFITEKSLVFGENMRAARKQRGFTSDSLASFLGISTAYVGLIERGERCPSLETFLKICDFFGESPETMLTPSGAGLAVRETKLAARNIDEEKKKRRHKMVLSMLDTFDPVELDHVVNMIKSFKSYVQMCRGEAVDEE
ncbi:MAG: helix-turn-helix domain-containing protein [Clostridiales bacterium]|jgi:transcriptional regulator with XRE-family HTH domain|nr:helix-turn-helix domain-containing protein [Clostridiales bacterium]